MTRLAHLPKLRVDGRRPGRVPLVGTWRNDGIAPCYESFCIEWTLLDAQGAVVASELTFPETPTTQWWPGEEVEVTAMLRVPAGTAEGRYVLKVAMVAPERGERIRLGLAGRDAHGRYELCQLTAVPQEPAQAAVYQTGFETDAAGWAGAAGMTAAVDAGAAHDGKQSLRVAGVQQKGWNYAPCHVPAPLTPAGKYRLTAWLLVDEMEPAVNPPYIKIGINDADGKWIENYSSERYDLRRMGTWQPMTVVADVPLHAASAHLAIEKGAYSTPIRATIRLDNVKLELIESP
ncbi:MAG: carbohydrate binding domain-containing protein [Thermoguttaceae bacterium]|jgi:hypothetical protein|nr:carbohydrate binding domain-containing protein [Thermoguttaceae bacterium]